MPYDAGRTEESEQQNHSGNPERGFSKDAFLSHFLTSHVVVSICQTGGTGTLLPAPAV
jgi:hypothetical protein